MTWKPYPPEPLNVFFKLKGRKKGLEKRSSRETKLLRFGARSIEDGSKGICILSKN